MKFSVNISTVLVLLTIIRITIRFLRNTNYDNCLFYFLPQRTQSGNFLTFQHFLFDQKDNHTLKIISVIIQRNFSLINFHHRMHEETRKW
jgi:hypothetical protein